MIELDPELDDGSTENVVCNVFITPVLSFSYYFLIWVGPVVHKSKWSFSFMHNLTTAYSRQRGSKPEVPEGGDILMNRECCVLFKLDIFLVRFLEFTVDRKL